MQIAIAILVANANQGISYVKRLVKNFKARVLSYPNSIFEAEPCLVATLTELNDIELLKKASLIITPNAYNEGVLYDVVPNTPLGDMDVVRATTATRVNEQGLIEVVPRNLLTYSNDFTNADWVKLNCSITANNTISPDGNLNASKLTSNNTGNFLYNAVSATDGIYTFSCFVKKLDTDTINISVTDFETGSSFGIFNFTTGLFASVVNGGSWTNTTANATNLQNGWFKISLTSQKNAGTVISSRIDSFANGTSVYIYGAQTEQGSTATEYFPTTTRLNIPRIDYTNGSCPSLLVEPQRTNLVPNPFAYTGSGVAFNSTVANSPISGGLSTRITKNEAAGTLRYAQQTCSASALLGSTNYTISAFFKYDGYDVQTSMEYNNSGQWGTTSWVQLINIASTGITLGTSSDCTSTIQNYGNGWYRINVTILTGATITSTPPVTYLMRVASTLSTGQGFLHTAAQLEAGAYATSYIPTVASSVTRNADVISKTGISSLIGQTEGAIFCDVNLNSRVSFTYFAISPDGTAPSSYIGIYFTGSVIGFECVLGGVVQAGIALANSNTGRFKIAAAYKNNDFVLYINGTQIGTTLSGTVPSCSQLGLNAFNQAQAFNYNSAQLYKTRLTDAECIALTTI